jgi:hypothetical protein
MSILHSTAMAFLVLGFVTRITHFRTLEKARRSRRTIMPLQVWLTCALMGVFVVPISNYVDIALYSIAVSMFFAAAVKWRNTVHDFITYRKAGILQSDTLPGFRERWNNRVRRNRAEQADGAEHD